MDNPLDMHKQKYNNSYFKVPLTFIEKIEYEKPNKNYI